MQKIIQETNDMKLNNFGKRYKCYTDIVKKETQKKDNHKPLTATEIEKQT